MSYTCRACGEQATLTACEHCGGQGRSQSAIAEIARLRAELATRDAAIVELRAALEDCEIELDLLLDQSADPRNFAERIKDIREARDAAARALAKGAPRHA